MKLTIQVNEFRDAIGKVLSVIDKKSSRPILTYAFLNAENNEIELQATDLEVSIKIKVKAQVELPGSLCVNARNIGLNID